MIANIERQFGTSCTIYFILASFSRCLPHSLTPHGRKLRFQEIKWLSQGFNSGHVATKPWLVLLHHTVLQIINRAVCTLSYCTNIHFPKRGVIHG